ncbi:MAG: AmmeMemoRadiSam system protein B [archaeon]
MIRPPAVAGTFYPLSTEDLNKAIANCFTREFGAGTPKSKGEKVIAAVVPHAGYTYSGPVATYIYKKLKNSETKTYVILGPNHTGAGPAISIMANGKWATPLGQVEIDAELAARILSDFPDAEIDETAHVGEHSIEVQLPFLQYVAKDFKIVPICMMDQSPATAISMGRALATACDDSVTVLASSDFTHFEPQPIASEKDHEAISAIEKLDIEKFYSILQNYSMSVCGYGPIIAAMAYAKEKGAKAGKLLQYATSGDITGDKTSVVGYAAIEFE